MSVETSLSNLLSGVGIFLCFAYFATFVESSIMLVKHNKVLERKEKTRLLIIGITSILFTLMEIRWVINCSFTNISTFDDLAWSIIELLSCWIIWDRMRVIYSCSIKNQCWTKIM